MTLICHCTVRKFVFSRARLQKLRPMSAWVTVRLDSSSSFQTHTHTHG